MKKRPKSLLEEKDQRQSHVTGKDQHHFFGLQLHRLVIEHYVLSSFSALIGSDQKKKEKVCEGFCLSAIFLSDLLSPFCSSLYRSGLNWAKKYGG